MSKRRSATGLSIRPSDGLGKLNDTFDTKKPRVPSKKKAGEPRFNLRGVVEVLRDEGYEPIAEILKTLKKKAFDNDTGKEVMVIDDRTRLMINTALLEYTSPKLKSTELRVKELPADLRDARITALLAKAAAADLEAITDESDKPDGS